MPILITIEVSTIISAQAQHSKLVMVQFTLIWTMRSIYWMGAALHLFSFCRLVVVLCGRNGGVVWWWRGAVQTERKLYREGTYSSCAMVDREQLQLQCAVVDWSGVIVM